MPGGQVKELSYTGGKCVICHRIEFISLSIPLHNLQGMRVHVHTLNHHSFIYKKQLVKNHDNIKYRV